MKGKEMGKKITVSIKPASGRSRKVELDATGSTLAEVMAAAGIADSSMKATVNGNAADLTDHVPDGAKVVFTEKAAGS
jgi:sulfur carrier protein ThiS